MRFWLAVVMSEMILLGIEDVKGEILMPRSSGILEVLGIFALMIMVE